MPRITSVRLTDEAQEALNDLRKKLGNKFAKPSVSGTISMILTRQIDLNDYPLTEKVKKFLRSQGQK